MKAYMSRTDAPLARVDAMFRAAIDHRFPRSQERLAIAEAERILADVQPMRPGYRAADRKLLAPVADRVMGVHWMTDDAREALADALTAFLATPLDCPHVGLDYMRRFEQYEHDHYCYNQGGHKHYSAEA